MRRINHPWTQVFTYLLTPWCRVPLEQLTGLQIFKKFPAFHGTRRFIIAFTSDRHLSLLGQPNPVHIPNYHLLEIHPNIIHPSTPRSPHCSLSLRFPHQDPLSSPIRATSPAQLISSIDYIYIYYLSHLCKAFKITYLKNLVSRVYDVAANLFGYNSCYM